MSLKKLIDLANGNIKPIQLTPKQIKEWQARIKQFDIECAERARNRIPTQEQMNKVIDYGIRHD
ncbi:hypothetical protein MZD04_gp417 [Pseudomonas phage Psa21]|uniref:Uncharacterized protein n=1 Tax=Pseudomonas phage Psa21 TaxID=2530023 RepID=A0A481W514_9CAUD|nr:hypothetical protein MZD04_gp417 [Pseudomonas phage Psa21]QBJ02931.1 hypothetical protein PSA21_409 [Pseudomonas phage Psa21]